MEGWFRPAPTFSPGQNLAYLSVHLFGIIYFEPAENDNVEKVLSILDRYRFHELSEEEKLYLLYYNQWEVDGKERTLWEEIIQRDKITL